MKSRLHFRILSLAAVLLAAVFGGQGIYADEWGDGTLSLPRSGKEIVSLPSPSAAELCRHIDHAIDYSTGSVSLSFPLFNLEDGSLNLPISMSYRTGGIKADSDAGPLGVGWELNAGGFVARSVVGMPDETPNFSIASLLECYSSKANVLTLRNDVLQSLPSQRKLCRPMQARQGCAQLGFTIVLPNLAGPRQRSNILTVSQTAKCSAGIWE